MSIRIGFISYSLDTGLTGIGRYMIQLMRALMSLRQGVEVILLATERSDPYKLWDEFETHHLQRCRTAPGLFSWGNVMAAQAVKRYHLDVLHDPNGVAPFFGPSGGATRIVTIQDASAYVSPEAAN